MALPASAKPPPARRPAFRYFRPVVTRWMDNDVFGHVNNATYYSYLDSTVTAWMVANGVLGLASGPMWVVAENGCRFRGEVAFPASLSVGLRIGRLGSSSARWELALFQDGADLASAEGFFVHVHVDRATRRPCPMPDALRHIIERELTAAEL